jgi:long-chain acyl-CoA synthetase
MNPIYTVSASDLPLQRLYHWERVRAQQIYLTQPMGSGVVLELTWAQACDQIRRMATWLQVQGWPAGSKVAILGKNSAHWILADLAIWMAGHVSVPIYPTFNGESLSYILQHSESRACFVGKMDDVSNIQSGIPAGLPLIALPLAPSLKALQWSDLVAKTQPAQGSPLREENSVCTIIYTSGTTGKPKGVVHTFKSIAWALSSTADRVRTSSADRMISYLPLAHVAERMLIEQGSLRYGCHVFFAESLDTFVQDLRRARPTIFFSVPRLWVKFQQGVHSKMPPEKLQRLLKIPIVGRLVRRKILKGLGLDQCRIAVGGAAPMPVDVLQWYRDLGLDLIEAYGMTENCAISHCTLPGSRQTATVGLPFTGVESRIDAETGEIQMRCGSLMQGYFKEPEQTANTMTADGWLRTGDKGKIDGGGFLSITGRVKDIFKTSKGKYISPAPIEDLLVMHPDVEACAVTGSNLDQPLGLVMLSPESVAKHVSAAERLVLTQSLTEHLQSVNAGLEAHEKLSCLVVITTPWTPENGFVTPTLKVKRARIEEAYASQYATWFAQHKPVVWPAA